MAFRMSIRNRNHTQFFFLSCAVIFIIVMFFDALNKSTERKYDMKTTLIPCEKFLSKLSPKIPVLLIDLNFLMSLNKTICHQNESKRITIGVDKKYQLNNELSQDSFNIIYFSNDSNKDFLDFDADGRRILPRRFETRWIGNFETPTDTSIFSEFWKRSKFVGCVGLKITRNEEVYMPAQPTSDILAQLRDELIDNGMFPFLLGGTLLGWYRECSIIPHTRDMDLGVTAENFNPEYIKKLENRETNFRLLRKLGKIEDSFEITVISNALVRPRTDIFIMYDGVENGNVTYSYYSGLGGDGTEYRFIYGVCDTWCAAEMHGHLFWVPCNPEELIRKDYGFNWSQDHPSKNYIWNESGKNIRVNRKLSPQELKELYVIYAGAQPYLD